LTPSRATQWPTHGGGGAPRTCGWAHSALTALGAPAPAPPAAAIAALAAAAAAPRPARAAGASCEASLSASVKSSDEMRLPSPPPHSSKDAPKAAAACERSLPGGLPRWCTGSHARARGSKQWTSVPPAASPPEHCPPTRTATWRTRSAPPSPLVRPTSAPAPAACPHASPPTAGLPQPPMRASSSAAAAAAAAPWSLT